MSEKLKSKWVIIIIAVLFIFLIKDTLQIIDNANFNNINTHTKHVGYIIGFFIGLSHKVILDLFLIYIVLFKVDLSFKKNNI